jgi:hypothetical protein
MNVNKEILNFKRDNKDHQNTNINDDTFTKQKNKKQKIKSNLNIENEKEINITHINNSIEIEKSTIIIPKSINISKIPTKISNENEISNEKFFMYILNGDIYNINKTLDSGIIYDINMKDSECGFTSLHMACHEGNIEVAQLILNNGGNMKLETDFGFTAFHLACQKGHLDIVKLLAEKGMDIHLKSKYGYSGTKLAKEYGHMNVNTYLTATKICIVCNKPARSRCSHCSTRYCSSDCQLIDWKKHKKICKKNK